jgi:hypothetical protein
MQVFLSIFGCVLIDFWVTKNITGRYLIGMRWWSEIDKKGQTKYQFESYDYQVKHSPLDTSVFWWGLGLNIIYWSIMFFIDALSLDFLYVRHLELWSLTGLGDVDFHCSVSQLDECLWLLQMQESSPEEN